jgi:hypothetical protein
MKHGFYTRAVLYAVWLCAALTVSLVSRGAYLIYCILSGGRGVEVTTTLTVTSSIFGVTIFEWNSRAVSQHSKNTGSQPWRPWRDYRFDQHVVIFCKNEISVTVDALVIMGTQAPRSHASQKTVTVWTFDRHVHSLLLYNTTQPG